MESDCVFCKIVKKQEKSFTIFEDEKVISFLTIGPISKGHILIIPKEHYENLHDIPHETLKHLSAITKDLAHHIKQKLNATGINIVHASGKDAQQSVFHFHFHIVPRYKDDALDLWFHKKPSKKIDLEKTYKKLKIQKNSA